MRVLACGLCGSDVEKLGRAAPGTVLGHEVAGELEDGTRVTVMHRVPCGVCERCLAGHRVDVRRVRARCASRPAASPSGCVRRTVVPLPDALGELDGVWVEPLACVLRAAELVPRGRVLVVGCGAIGRLWMQVLSRRGDDVSWRSTRVPNAWRERESSAPSWTTARSTRPSLTAPAGVGRRAARGSSRAARCSSSLRLRRRADVARRGLPQRAARVVGSRSASPDVVRARRSSCCRSSSFRRSTTLPLERFAEGVELYRRGDALKVVFTP